MINKLLNNNIALIVCLLIFICLDFAISALFPVLVGDNFGIGHGLVAMSAYLLVALLYQKKSQKPLLRLPLWCSIGMCVVALYHLFSEHDSLYEQISLVKRDILLALAYQLWYPILRINNDRLYKILEDSTKNKRYYD